MTEEEKAPEIDTVLLLDTETTSLEVEDGELAELGTVLWSVPHGCIIDARSDLVRSCTATGRNAAIKVNKIPAELLVRAPALLASTTSERFAQAQMVLAWNALFDRKWFSPDVQKVAPWACAMDDIEWPEGVGKSLAGTALAHGVGVVRAHRALDDCLILASLLEACVARGVDVQRMLQRSLRPKGLFRAEVPFKQKDLAKDAGFKWDPDEKEWTRWLHLDRCEPAHLVVNEHFLYRHEPHTPKFPVTLLERW